MRTSTIFSTLFIARRSKSVEDQGTLYVRLTYKSKSVDFSLGRRFDISLWDSRRRKMKGNTKRSKELNEFMRSTEAELRNIYEDLRKLELHISVDSIKSRYLNEDESRPTITELIKYHYELAESSIRPGTLKNYRTTERYLKLFMSDKLKVNDIYLCQLSYSFITKFENYLRMYEPTDHQRKMTNNTVMKHIQRFRKMIGLAVRLEWIEKDPFSNFKTKFVKKDRGFLTAMELAAIEEKAFTIDRLQYVRDLFVFSCYTGLSYIDAVSLVPDNIMTGIDGGKWISIIRRKTDNAVKVPLLPKAEQLLEKYAHSPRSLHHGTCFPPISNQKLNAYLKELADLCGITKKVTFHLARHTFATTVVLANGVSLYGLSKMLGHSKITTTQIYGRMQDARIAEEMNLLKEKLKDREPQSTPTNKIKA